ncbi:HPF/RaiA family ribosome-associated protein [Halosquirtibacter laminarini]|uniref:HPF/RaiA family ribosome-associated protein n=1 Tax=Halosquirtibacter laminarini TaxID=3374600 RepID=A0AC61NCA7_9BACT|nr:HPF/RaiA family ribosome-associated protein [Prolixibacteraceae bacterium]
MKVTFQSVQFKADQKLLDFTEKKVEKLDQYFDSIIGAEVIFRLVSDQDKVNKVAEIKLSIPEHDYLFAKKNAVSFEEAVDLAVAAVKHQLERVKEKSRFK